MNTNFKASLKMVLKHEGGYVNNPKDPGGATNKGVTIGTFRAFVKRDGTITALKNITDAQLETVYKKQYWDAVRGDDLPSGIDYAVFDFAVNSGPTRAAKYLQDVVGADVDGHIGGETITATRARSSKDVINLLCDKRMAFLRGLSTWPTFGKGWSSRVSGVRSAALSMIAAPTAPIAAPVAAAERTPETQPTAPPLDHVPVSAPTAPASLLGVFLAMFKAWGIGK